MSQKLELISFKLCPFVQRAVIVLKNKSVDFDMTFIDLNNPPEWFKELSPLGQVPVLKVGHEVLFESSVIQEYIDEINPPSLHPKDTLLKAKNRAWIAFAGSVFEGPMKMIRAHDATQYEEAKGEMLTKFGRLEDAHSGQDFFNGSEFQLIDAAYAPLFMRLDIIGKACGVDFLSDLPKMTRWSKACLTRECVQSSVVPELPQLYIGMIQNMNGYLASLVK